MGIHYNPYQHIEERLNILETLVRRVLEELTNGNPYERVTRKVIHEEYKVSYGTIHNAMKKGALIYEKVGTKTLFKRSDVEKWIKSYK